MIRLSENFRLALLTLGLAVVLVVLGVLQYHSSLQISEATGEQMRATLRGSLLEMRLSLERELALVCRDLQPLPRNSERVSLSQYASRLEQWRRTAPHPDLVSHLFVWQEANGSRPQLLRLDSKSGEFGKAERPENFATLRERLSEMSHHLDLPFGGEPTGFHRDSGPPPPMGLESGRPFWMIDEGIPALVYPVHETQPEMSASPLPVVTWLIVELNRQVLTEHVLPELAQRYFGGTDGLVYQVAVLQREGPMPVVLYSSEPGFGSGSNTLPDASMSLFGPPLPTRPVTSAAAPPPGMPRGEGMIRLHPDMHGPGGMRLDPIRYADGERDWQVIARHREGSVEAAVAGMRRRNLALNFGVLLVLAFTMGMIVVASLRARRLARLQMDFVANVSHELRTPITGILSGAQNLADGVVENHHQVARYGSAIAGQAQQLSDLVEQILLFSATQKDRHRYNLQLAGVAEVVDASLRSMAGLIRSSGFVVEKEVAPDLPQVQVDVKALGQCLQNLITNAVKYSGEQRWIGIRAALTGAGGKKEIAITVADRGMGIDSEELSHIFEPFYRSPLVTAAQIHGSGLGLPLAKSIALAMGGRLTVQSTPGSGSIFTLYLPDPGPVQAPVADAAVVKSIS